MFFSVQNRKFKARQYYRYADNIMAEGTVSSHSLVQEQNTYGNALRETYVCSSGKEGNKEMTVLRKIVTPHTALEQSLQWEVADKYSTFELYTVEQSGLEQNDAVLETRTKIKDRVDVEDLSLLKLNPVRLSLPPSGSATHRIANQPADSQSFRSSSGFTDINGRDYREQLSHICRQKKQVSKLKYDNAAAQDLLHNAQSLIDELKARIERKNKHMKERNDKEEHLTRVLESLRRERGEKLHEYKFMLKSMKEALADKETNLEDAEMERTQAENLYQKQLKENTELIRKIEIREKQIRQLKERAAKAKRWKDEVRI